jgi:hypothetical protein
MTEDEAMPLYQHTFVGVSGGAKAVVDAIGKRKFPPAFVRKVFLATAASPFARGVLRGMALRQAGFRDAAYDPLRLDLLAALRTEAVTDDPLPEANEQRIWLGVTHLIEAFNAGVIGDKDLKLILTLWDGKFDPAEVWDELASKLDRGLRAEVAFAFGRRYLYLARERNEPGLAGFGTKLLREVLERADRTDILYGIAEYDLAAAGR